MRNKLAIATGVLFATITALTGVASAAPDPAASVTTYLGDAFADLTPVIVAVATGSLGILVLGLGFRMARKAVTSRGRGGV